eukprot:TRINITY_DN1453_c1_g2_i1.p1 TRINITY_DN1453_c1_g2~~TRINITY_DN1453_c1_g2_i1.p1  ORF type:complete len:865 (+),score=164.83 TRINITY_DN1453_c1_g2_i1:109-2703(+)
MPRDSKVSSPLSSANGRLTAEHMSMEPTERASEDVHSKRKGNVKEGDLAEAVVPRPAASGDVAAALEQLTRLLSDVRATQLDHASVNSDARNAANAAACAAAGSAAAAERAEKQATAAASAAVETKTLAAEATNNATVVGRQLVTTTTEILRHTEALTYADEGAREYLEGMENGPPIPAALSQSGQRTQRVLASYLRPSLLEVMLESSYMLVDDRRSSVPPNAEGAAKEDTEGGRGGSPGRRRNDIQTIYNMFVAALAVFFFAQMVQTYLEAGVLIDISLMSWVFSDAPWFMVAWAVMYTSAHLFAFPVGRGVAVGLIPPLIARIYGSFIFCVFLAASSWATWERKLPPATGLAVMCEAARFAMKVHAFIATVSAARERHCVTEQWRAERAAAEFRSKRALALQDDDETATPTSAADTPASKKSKTKSKKGGGTAATASAVDAAEGGPSAAAAPGIHAEEGKRSHLHTSLRSSDAPTPTTASAMRPMGSARAESPSGSSLSPPDGGPAFTEAEENMLGYFDYTAGGGFPANVTYGSYEFFLWAPTLLYQPRYPRNRTVRWRRVLTTAVEVFFCVWYQWVLFARFCGPYLRLTTDDLGTTVLAVFQTMTPSFVALLLGFFLILHSWMNLWGELLRFGDRQFYLDWWNARNWAEYYRKWNIVVHKWLYRFVYLEVYHMSVFYRPVSASDSSVSASAPLSRSGSKGSTGKAKVASRARASSSVDADATPARRRLRVSATTRQLVAMLATFLVSALVHEIIVAAALHMFYPVLLILFGLPGVLFIFLTSGNTHRFWNVFMWAMLMIGSGMLCALYGRGWRRIRAGEFEDPVSVASAVPPASAVAAGMHIPAAGAPSVQPVGVGAGIGL